MAEKGKKKNTEMPKKIPKDQLDKISGSCDSKKPSMKTATDVISRLLWDDSLPQEKFTVGYLDRFDGIIEKPFTSLDWSNPAAVDNYTLALPKHRIQYFKYKSRKVWDKTTRKDIIFGSTGAVFNIHQFMAIVDKEEEDFRDEEFFPNEVEGNISPESVESDEEFDFSDRPNFFIAARITNENTVRNLKQISDYIKSRDEVLGECCIAPEIYHLTLCILKLDSPSNISDAISAMHALASKHLPIITLNLDGLDNFRQRVLYSRIENKDLLELRNALLEELVARKLTITDRFSFVPHVTVAKLSRSATRLRHSKYIDQYLYLKFEDDEFGTEIIDKLYLCEMKADRREDGFYMCASEVPLT